MAKFEDAIMRTIHNEVGGEMNTGGYVNDPDDPGGETKWGISKRTYPHLDIKNLTLEDAIAIYKRDFWHYDNINDQTIAAKVFDMHVNMGEDAYKCIQDVLGITVDGIYGHETEDAINVADPDQLIVDYRARLAKHYELIVQAHPNEAKFLPDWKRRAEE